MLKCFKSEPLKISPAQWSEHVGNLKKNLYLHLKCPNIYNSIRVEMIEIRRLQNFTGTVVRACWKLKKNFLCKSEISELIQTNLC